MTRVHAVLEHRIPPGQDWLTDAERQVLAGLRFERRRMDWLLGRWAAKRAVTACLGATSARPPGPGAADIAILADDEGVPRVVGAPGPVRVSISHRGGQAFCVAAAGDPALGCDLERVEPRSRAFIDDYFTHHEADGVRAALPETRPLLANLVWAGKEAALKAVGQGLRLDTRSVEVCIGELDDPTGPPAETDGPPAWRALAVTVRQHAPAVGPVRLEGRWCRHGEAILVVVTDRPFDVVLHETDT